MQITEELFNILPLKLMAENAKIKKYYEKSDDELIKLLKFEFINGLINIKTKSNYVMFGTLENLQDALSDENIYDAEEFILEQKDVEKLDDFQMLAEVAKLMTPNNHKTLVFELINGNVVSFMERKKYKRSEGIYAIQVFFKNPRKKKVLKLLMIKL